jgi:hypothetical protein
MINCFTYFDYGLSFTVRFVVPRLGLLQILVFVVCDAVSLSE